MESDLRPSGRNDLPVDLDGEPPLRKETCYSESRFILHKVFSTSFRKSQSPHKSVNLFIVKDKSTDALGI